MTRPARLELAAAEAVLAAAGVPAAAGDARALLRHAFGPLAVHNFQDALTRPLPADVAHRFQAALAARARRQPVSQIIGTRPFWRQVFTVTPDVLDPRPETETLVALALTESFTRILDLGTGSGCILLSLLAERAEATGLGTDISDAALAVARGNARALGLAGRAAFGLSDWYGGIDGVFDLIVSNPPYIAAAEMGTLAPEVHDWEPHLALTPGGDGLGAYRVITAGARTALAPGGRLLLEIGPTQGAQVAALCRDAGLQQIALHRDLDGRDRVIAALAPLSAENAPHPA